MQSYMLIPDGGEQTQMKGPLPDLAGKRVVVVEDEGITQMQLKKALTQAGLVVAGSATNGRAGVDVVLRERPDLVLMDIRMPVMNGLDAAREILKTVPVCVVMLTAFSDAEYREQAEQIGTCGYVLKPVTAATLIPQIQAAYRDFHPR